MDKDKKIKESLEKRNLEKEKLFDLMFVNKSKKKVQDQFLKFEKAHKEALEAYKDVA